MSSDESEETINLRIRKWVEEYDRLFDVGSIKTRKRNLHVMKQLKEMFKQEGSRVSRLLHLLDLLIALEEYTLSSVEPSQT